MKSQNGQKMIGCQSANKEASVAPTIVESTVGDDLGTANEWTVTFSGLSDQPDFLYHLRAYSDTR